MTTHPAYNRAVDIKTHAYTILFLSLTALMFVGPVLVELQIGELVHGLVLMTTLAAAMYGVGNSRLERRLILLLGIVAAILFWAHQLGASTSMMAMPAYLGSAIFYGYVTYILLRDIVSGESRVSAELIAGAVAVYLLLGVFFANLFGMLHTLDPGSFSGVIEGSGHPAARFYYFSMVTLTTLGYGDIVPLKDTARGLSTLEALLGQVYLTVIVAQLVGMHISDSLTTKASVMDQAD
jgi:hypothetical protein